MLIGALYRGELASKLKELGYRIDKTHADGRFEIAGVPRRVGVNHGAAYALHSHHIFPQALLYRSGWDSDNYMHRQTVNEIANRAYLTASSNLSLSDTQPADYLPEVERKYPGALGSQFIPMDPASRCSSDMRSSAFASTSRSSADAIATSAARAANPVVRRPRVQRHGFERHLRVRAACAQRFDDVGGRPAERITDAF